MFWDLRSGSCSRSRSCVVPTLVLWLFTLVSVRFGFMVDASQNDLTRVRHIKILKIDLRKPIITYAVDGLTKRLSEHVHDSAHSQIND